MSNIEHLSANDRYCPRILEGTNLSALPVPEMDGALLYELGQTTCTLDVLRPEEASWVGPDHTCDENNPDCSRTPLDVWAGRESFRALLSDGWAGSLLLHHFKDADNKQDKDTEQRSWIHAQRKSPLGHIPPRIRKTARTMKNTSFGVIPIACHFDSSTDPKWNVAVGMPARWPSERKEDLPAHRVKVAKAVKELLKSEWGGYKATADSLSTVVKDAIGQMESSEFAEIGGDLWWITDRETVLEIDVGEEACRTVRLSFALSTDGK